MVSSSSLIEHALTERLPFELLRPPPGQTRFTVDGRRMARYNANIISMGHRSDSAGSDLSAHPSQHDSSARTQPVTGDDDRDTTSPFPCKPMHVEHRVDTVNEHTCSFHIIPDRIA